MSYDFNRLQRVSGVVIGKVTDNVHPEGAYAVKLAFPWISSADCGDDQDFPSTWCPVASPFAGKGRGFYCLPEVGDEVVVAFMNGEMRFPIVIGSLWNKECTMPVGDASPAEITDPLGNTLGVKDICVDNNAAGGKNDARFLLSRAGSGMIFADGDDAAVHIFTSCGSVFTMNDKTNVIAMFDTDQETYLALDAKNKKIILECTNGDIDVLCKNGTFNLEAKKITTKASTDQEHKADAKWKAESGSTMDIKAGGDYKCEAPKIKLNP